ncbi:ankyrin-2 [Nasonia vitripennis]|uniref:Uncharacterized protein n=1 Tax=Nasonia vitripennis TaxID=7425 RepID=A0A7M7H800_NASVI|nr:ankyrin-2 [Nasonia vitripennis]XP_008208762.1 ankyrin-2 [Nasonia vitripennis]XP_016843581.1 ankyrin-2 [Nasonia vitripennis]XP_016843582.1 ankyrin-2 [Nasonia vitripennis]XP_031784562.1 ankyrin-2 [Nasonia vitripennis]XP_031784563.1 ankyrin-2 [Nasonia vitripennis]
MDLNMMNSDRNAALLVAIRKSDSFSVKSILKSLKSNKLGTDPNWTDYTLLVIALHKGRITIAHILIDNGCRTQSPKKTNFFYTPLFYAVRLGRIDLVKKLLVKGASILDKDQNNETALSYAVRTKRFQIVNLMFAMYDFKTVNPNNKDHIAHFHIACERNMMKVVKKFIAHGMPVNGPATHDINKSPGFTPLHFAADNLSVDAVKFLLRNGADVAAQDARGLSPLHIAYFKDVNKSRCTRDGSCFYTMKLEFLESKLMKLKKESIVGRILIAHVNDSPNPVDENGVSHFHIACANETCIVERFLEHGKINVNASVSLDSKQLSGYTPLHVAVQYQRAKTIQVLLDAGAHINAKAREGMTPLHLAVKNSTTKIIELLLKNNADVRIKNDDGFTPLHFAFYHFASDDVINLLLQYCSKTENSIDGRGVSHFHIACTKDNVELVEYFLKNNVSVDSVVNSNESRWAKFTGLHFAVYYNKRANVELLLKYKANASLTEEQGLSALHLACNQNLEKFSSLVKRFEQECGKNKPSKSIDWTKNREDHIAIIKLLLEHGADINAKEKDARTPMFYAIDFTEVIIGTEWHLGSARKSLFDFQEDIKRELCARRLEIIQILLSHKADVNVRAKCSKTILHSICSNVDLVNEDTDKMVSLFLSEGAEVDAVDEYGLTPLHMATQNRDVKVINLLLQHKADVNYKQTIRQLTALHMATNGDYESCDVATIKALISHGAELNARDTDGRTPLHYLGLIDPSNGDDPSLFRCLLEAECDVDARDKNGQTPLYLACSSNNYVAVEQFLKYGANLNIEDNNGHIILDPIINRLKDPLGLVGIGDWLARIEIILHYMTTMIAAGLFFNKKLRKAKAVLYTYYKKLNLHIFYNTGWDRIDKLDNFFVKCRAELAKMKGIFVDSYSSLNSIIYKDQQGMSKHVKNTRFTKILNSESFEKDYPLYGFILKLQYKKGLRRASLLKPAQEAWNTFCPANCPVEHIFRYLSDGDLKNLIKAKVENSFLKRKLIESRDRGEPSEKMQRTQ